jgi:acetyl/propionyl-CoA carboxylase alpha subunit
MRGEIMGGGKSLKRAWSAEEIEKALLKAKRELEEKEKSNKMSKTGKSRSLFEVVK